MLPGRLSVHMLPVCIMTVVCSAIHINSKGSVTTLCTILSLTDGSAARTSLRPQSFALIRAEQFVPRLGVQSHIE